MFAGPALRVQPDRRLVKLVRNGSETAFDEILRRYGSGLQRYAGAIVTRQRAEDVTQDAFSTRRSSSVPGCTGSSATRR